MKTLSYAVPIGNSPFLPSASAAGDLRPLLDENHHAGHVVARARQQRAIHNPLGHLVRIVPLAEQLDHPRLSLPIGGPV